MKVEKLQSVGTLAGGIAHDFNNLLTAILGNITIAQRQIKPENEAYHWLEEAEGATVRARELTQQLLTFSKGGAPVKTLVSISKLINDTAKFTLRGSKSNLELSLPLDIWAIEADEGQLSQVIQNIVLNADEAMPNGGTIHIRAKNTYIDELKSPSLPKGNYILIEIQDEGIGMSKEQLKRIYEPYYSTKQKGSGLGLSTSYSIVKNHGGYLTAKSKPNIGSTFHIYLPATNEPLPDIEYATKAPITGSGKILVMDDQESIRLLLSNMLPISGYQVEITSNGLEAINKFAEAKNSGSPFDAVILDLTVPGGIGGEKTIERLLEIDPDIKVAVSSGYSDDPIMTNYKEHGFSAVIKKPFGVSDIEKILHILLADK
jgi:CheY-like chemotaxis protein